MAFWSLFVASLVGSPHCVAMCGGFAGYIAGKYSWPSLLSYHGARLVTYAILGALAGMLGTSVDDLGVLTGIHAAAPLVVAVLLLGQAALILLRVPRLNLNHFGSILPKLARKGGPLVPPLLGVLTAFLPCGWLYSFVILAMSSGGALQGAAMLFVFGLGTLPALVVLGDSLRRLLVRTGLAPQTVTLLFLILAGVFSLGQHQGWWSSHHHHHHHHSS